MKYLIVIIIVFFDITENMSIVILPCELNELLSTCDIPTRLRLISTCRSFATLSLIDVVTPLELVNDAIQKDRADIVMAVSERFTDDVCDLHEEIISFIARDCRPEVIKKIVEIFEHFLSVECVFRIAENEDCSRVVVEVLHHKAINLQYDHEITDHFIKLIDNGYYSLAREIYYYDIDHYLFTINLGDVFTNLDHEQIVKLETWDIPEFEDYFNNEAQQA